MIARFSLYVKRFLTISLGFCVAMMIAGLLATLALRPDVIFSSDPQAQLSHSLLVFFTALVLGGLTAGWVVLPALVLVFVAEWRGLRNLLFYEAIGTVFALAVVMFGDIQPHNVSLVPSVMIVMAAGLLAGFAYWAIAGRHAGKWLEAAIEQF